MITGANTNVRYRGILFHVQTEDSGRANPHVISHLYHGGTILGSEKSDYREHIDDADLLGIVKRLIDEQHAAMVKRLKSGGFDGVIHERLGETAGAAIARGAEAEPESKPDTRPDGSGAPPPPRPSPVEPDTAVASRAGAAAAPRAFGEGLGSGKPLDEVILDYLCDKARGRATGGSGPTRTNRSEG